MGISRNLDQKKTFAIYRVDAPYKPITSHGVGKKMGGGKGSIDHYGTPVKAGRIILEIGKGFIVGFFGLEGGFFALYHP